MFQKRKKRLLILYYSVKKIDSLPYSHGYPKAFSETELFDVTMCNFGALKPKKWYERWRAVSKKPYDAVVMLHTAGHDMYSFWADALHKLGAPVVWFIGNEYRGMPSKMEFAREIGISLLVSQSLSESIHKIYREHLGCKVIGLLNSGFNEKLFPPGPPISSRKIDIGYRMFAGPPWLGHWDRETIAEKMLEVAKDKFKVDISLSAEDRLQLNGWKHFLQNSKSQLSVSSGGDIFELTDNTRYRVEALLKEDPNATRSKIASVFPPEKERVRIRTLSSRILEAAATRTPQIMYRDDFDGPMRPDIEYIALNKNYDNIDDVLEQIQDHQHLEQIANNCAKTLRDFASFSSLLSTFDSALDEII